MVLSPFLLNTVEGSRGVPEMGPKAIPKFAPREQTVAFLVLYLHRRRILTNLLSDRCNRQKKNRIFYFTKAQISCIGNSFFGFFLSVSVSSYLQPMLLINAKCDASAHWRIIPQSCKLYWSRLLPPAMKFGAR